MKKWILLLVVAILPFILYAQPQWEWGNNGNCATDDQGNIVAVDKNGNVYVTGVFAGTMQLDTATLVSLGDKDVFLAKYTAGGQLLWVRTGGSTAEENVSSITIDTVGNVYITGSFGKHIIYPFTTTDTAYFSGTSVISNGDADIFFAKYDTGGDILWLKGYGSEYDDGKTTLAYASSYKILVTGNFSEGGPAGIIHLDAATLNASAGAMFTAQCNVSGNMEWVKQYKASSEDIVIDPNGNFYITGEFPENTSFDSHTISSLSSGFVLGDVYIAKFNAIGNAMWAKPIGGVGPWSSVGGTVVPISAAVSSSGNVYITGSYSHCSLKFHNSATLPYSDQFQIFLAKYDTNGDLIWAREMGGASWDFSYGIHLDKDENIYLTGAFHDEGYFGNDTITGYGADDAFIAKYDSSGNEIWVVNMGGTSNEIGYSLTGDENESLYVAGSFRSSVFYYGADSLINSGTVGTSDMFLAKLSQTTGIPQLNTPESNLLLYPNPTSGVLHLQTHGERYTFASIYDQLGRQVGKLPVSQGKINLEYLPNGVYLLRLEGNRLPPLNRKVIIHH